MVLLEFAPELDHDHPRVGSDLISGQKEPAYWKRAGGRPGNYGLGFPPLGVVISGISYRLSGYSG